MRRFRKIDLFLCCLICLLSSCQNSENLVTDNNLACTDAYLPEPNFTTEELFDRSDFVYLIELGDILGSWYNPIFDCGKNYDVWGYTIIESYKGTTDNYYMFVPKSINSKLSSESLYYVFLQDYSYLDDGSGFPDYFISLDLYYYLFGIYPAEGMGE